MRQAVRKVSPTGGQGRLKCSCKIATCQTNRCACFKANKKCNSRCHPANSRCRNHDNDDDFGDNVDNVGGPNEEQNPTNEHILSSEDDDVEDNEKEVDEEEDHDHDEEAEL